jgi:Ala-tRNA(Pro) deacylase
MTLSEPGEFLDSHNIKISSFLIPLPTPLRDRRPHARFGQEAGKNVKIDGILAMAVVPASHHVDFDRLRALRGAQMVETASKREFKDAFPDSETGAMPTFGILYDMPVYADASLGADEEITFSAGTHRELVRMRWDDLPRLVNPTVDNLTHRKPAVVAAEKGLSRPGKRQSGSTCVRCRMFLSGTRVCPYPETAQPERHLYIDSVNETR